MSKYFTLGSYSISILHYSLYHWDKRELVFLRAIRAYENWLAAYYGYKEDDERMHDIWLRWIKEDPGYMVKFGEKHQKNFHNLNKYLDDVLEGVAKADKKKILPIFEQYWELLSFSQPIGDINLNIDKIYLELLTKKFQDFLDAKGCSDKFSEYLIDLTTPWEMLPTMREELDFLRIVLLIQQAAAEDSVDLLNKHLENYEWIPCWYDNAPWDLTYLQDRLNKELKTKNVKERIERIKSFPERTKNRAGQIIHDLAIDGELLQHLSGLRTFTYIRTEVDLHTGYIVHKARPIYLRLAELLNISFEQLKFLTPDEIKSALQNKLLTGELVERVVDRQKFAVQIFERDKQTILTGNKARELIKEIVADLNVGESSVVRKTNELVGIGASLGSGVVKGSARVIGSISQLDSMQDGEVLIVPSTSVDYVAAMKKAAAIVTEVGGLTCHAAIVSRELEKPCIVNTISATRVFKTGDMVEVDAKRGVIKKVN